MLHTKHGFYLAIALTTSITTSLTGATVWEGGTTNLATPSNWTGGVIPNGALAIAQFDSTGAAFQPTLSTLVNLSNILFPALNPAPYTFTLSNNALLAIACDNGGINNQSGLPLSSFVFNLSNTSQIVLSGSSLNSLGVSVNLSGTSKLIIADSEQVVLNIGGSDTGTKVELQGGNLIVGSQDATTTFAGTLQDSGLLTKVGSGTFTLSGTGNSSSDWATTINEGAINFGAAGSVGTGTITFTPGTTGSTTSALQDSAVSTLVTLPNAIQIDSGFTAEINVATDGILALSGPITDLLTNGIASFTGDGIIVLQNSGGNSYSGTTTVGSDTLLQSSVANGFSPHSAFLVEGSLASSDGTNDFSNQIYSLSGSGEVTTGLLGTGTLAIVGNSNTTFSGNLNGNGYLNLQGGTLALTGDSSPYAGSTSVANSTLNLNGLLGGSLSVQSGGILTGTGTASRVSVLSGGTISPGNSIGTLNVIGTYTQGPNTTYNVEINAAGESDLIDVSGAAVLSGGTVVVTSVGGLDFGSSYTILSAAGGVSGQFGQALSTGSSLITPILNYSNPFAVFLTLKPSIIKGAVSANQKQVALQLDTVDPDPQMTAVLNAFANLSPSQVTEALDQLSASPQTSDPFITTLLNREFLRRLYDPIRPLVTTLPACRCVDPCSSGIDVWVEGGWNRAFLRNDLNSFGFNLNGWEVTLGAQKTWCDEWTLGLAGSYEHDFVHHNISATSQLDSGFVGLYGLYRPDEYYVFADLAFGYTQNRLHRTIVIAPLSFVATSKPNIYDLTFYGEAGFDLPTAWVLVQPFVGIESISYWRSSVTESGAGDLGLTYFKRSRSLATGRLGLHLTTQEVCTFSLSLDGAWNYRLTSDPFTYNETFIGFGTPFTIDGAHFNKNSAEAAVTLSSQLNATWRLWAEFGGEIWRNASDYSLTAGLQASF